MSTNNIERFLKSRKIPFQAFEYVYTMEDLTVETIAQENGWPTDEIFKTLMLQNQEGQLIVVVISGIHQLHRKKVAKQTHSKKVHFIPVSQLQKLTGFVRGGCSPILPNRKARVLIDSYIESKQSILVNAGQRGKLLQLRPQDLIDICEADVLDLKID